MRISYILCLVCAACALISRIVAAFSTNSAILSSHALPIGYHSFMDGVLLFFWLTLASGVVAFVDKRTE
jgi:hypothetical protein